MKPGELAPLPDLFFARRFFHFEGVDGVAGAVGSLKEKARARLLLPPPLLLKPLLTVVGVARVAG